MEAQSSLFSEDYKWQERVSNEKSSTITKNACDRSPQKWCLCQIWPRIHFSVVSREWSNYFKRSSDNVGIYRNHVSEFLFFNKLGLRNICYSSTKEGHLEETWIRQPRYNRTLFVVELKKIFTWKIISLLIYMAA